MKKKTLKLSLEQIIRRILLMILFSASLIGLSLLNHFLFLEHPDRNVNHAENIAILIVIIVLSLIFLVVYLLNMFVFKNKKIHLFMSTFSDGGTIFLLLSSIVLMVISQDMIIFNKEHVSLFISSSFTLLGFGLTIVAILATRVVETLRQSNPSKRMDVLFSTIFPFFLFFCAGLIYTISALLNLQSIDAGYYKIIIYKSLFYSVIQMFFLVICIFKGFINFAAGTLIDDVNQKNDE